MQGRLTMVVIVDHRCAVRDWLERTLVGSQEYHVTGTFAELHPGLEFIHRQPCDILILGVPLMLAARRGNGKESNGWLKELRGVRFDQPWVPLYVEPPEERHFYRDVAQGFNGHIPSTWGKEELLNGLRWMKQVGISMHRGAGLQYAKFVQQRGEVKDTLEQLDGQDEIVAQGLLDGKSLKEMSVTLRSSERTARRYRDQLMVKINARTPAEAIAILVAMGYKPSSQRRD